MAHNRFKLGWIIIPKITEGEEMPFVIDFNDLDTFNNNFKRLVIGMFFDGWTLIVKAENSNNQQEVVLMFNLIDGIIDPTSINVGGGGNENIYLPLNWVPMEIHQAWETEDSYRQDPNEELNRKRAYDRSTFQLIIDAVIEGIISSGGMFHREENAAVIEAIWDALNNRLTLWDP